MNMWLPVSVVTSVITRFHNTIIIPHLLQNKLIDSTFMVKRLHCSYTYVLTKPLIKGMCHLFMSLSTLLTAKWQVCVWCSVGCDLFYGNLHDLFPGKQNAQWFFYVPIWEGNRHSSVTWFSDSRRTRSPQSWEPVIYTNYNYIWCLPWLGVVVSSLFSHNRDYFTTCWIGCIVR